MTGNSPGIGSSAMRQRRAPFFSCHPVRIGDSLWSYIMTLFLVKKNVIGVADGSEADKGLMERRHYFSVSGEVGG